MSKSKLSLLNEYNSDSDDDNFEPANKSSSEEDDECSTQNSQSNSSKDTCSSSTCSQTNVSSKKSSTNAVKSSDSLQQEVDSLRCSICLLNETYSSGSLVCCHTCGICVHTDCYGGINIDDITCEENGFWLCDPCSVGNKYPTCELCPHVGTGAYKRTNNNRYVHILCAVFTIRPEWNSIKSANKINLCDVQSNLFSNGPCLYCPNEELNSCGLRIRCESGMCRSYFHPYCGRKEQGLLEVRCRNERDPFLAYCKDHMDVDDLKRAVKRMKQTHVNDINSPVEESSTGRKQRQSTIESKINANIRSLHEDFFNVQKPKKMRYDRARPLTESPLFSRIIAERQTNEVECARDDTGDSPLPYLSCDCLDQMNNREAEITKMTSELEEQATSLAYVQKLELEDMTKIMSVMKETQSSISFLREITKALGIPIERDSKVSLQMRRFEKMSFLRKSTNFEEETGLCFPAKKCKICKNSKRRFSMIECDLCNDKYHGECLNPPIRSTDFCNDNKLYKWLCGKCTIPKKKRRNSTNSEQSADYSSELSNQNVKYSDTCQITANGTHPNQSSTQNDD